MESTPSTDKGVGFPLVFGFITVLGAAGMTVFGFTGDQLLSGWSFAAAVLAGAFSVATYHVYS